MSWNTFCQDTPLFIQGMTGQEGQRLMRWLRASGSHVIAGITPGKGGQECEGVPIFDTVDAACQKFPHVNASIIVVPAMYARRATEEALQAGLKYLTVFTEGVPVHDVREMRLLAARCGATILGPSSVGYLQFPPFRTGYIGGENPWSVLQEGGIALISSSGGMVQELMMGLSHAKKGIRVAFALGGDRVLGSSFEEVYQFCEAHPGVQQVVVFIEPGRSFLSALLQDQMKRTKPLILFLVGDALEGLPREAAYGHTGTFLSQESETVSAWRKRLEERGIVCVSSVEECVAKCF